MILHNSQEQSFRTPFGAVEHGKSVTLQCLTEQHWQGAKVTLRLWQNSRGEILIPMHADTEGQWHTVELNTSEFALEQLWYYFIVEKEEQKIYYGNNAEKLGGIGVSSAQQPESYQVTLYNTTYALPEWFTNGIVYQIFPDRFFKYNKGKKTYSTQGRVFHENWYNTPLAIKDSAHGTKQDVDFFGGNLKGIMEKLSYLYELGVTVIYLNPIFEADSNHRYNTGDYCKVDDLLGTQRDFENLCKKAELFGIKIILDGVFSHTGSNSIYFNKEGKYEEVGAYQSPASKYYSWYQFDQYPDQYKSWWNVQTLPNTNELNQDFQDFIINNKDSVLKRWIKSGASGWRLDVADELPLEFVRNFYRTLKENNPESILIGEVWEDATNKIAYSELRNYLDGNTLDTVMNYPLRSIMIDFILNKNTAEYTQKALMNIYENYPKHSFYAMMNLIGSHDRARILSILGEGLVEGQQALQLEGAAFDLAYKRLQLITMWQMTFPGVPCIYYGDEAGLQGGKDPYNRACYPWERENQDILEWYQKILEIRQTHEVLCSGEWEIVHAQAGVLAILRSSDSESILTVLNVNKDEVQIELPIVAESLRSLLDEQLVQVVGGIAKLQLAGVQGAVFSLEK